MPAWTDDDKLTSDPQREISLMYYGNKGGLEDRVFRIRTERSAARRIPEPRTSHNISNVEVIERRGDVVDVRFNWHTMYIRYRDARPVLRHVVLHDRLLRRQTPNPPQDRGAQERLHPSRLRYLSLLMSAAMSTETTVPRNSESRWPSRTASPASSTAARARRVADASYRQRINIPVGCRQGVCGTCKAHASQASTIWAATSRTR